MKYKFQSDQLVIELLGDVDEYYASSIRVDIDRLAQKDGLRRVIFDFAKVSFVDSTGIGLIFGRYKRLASKNIELVLMNVSSSVDKVFRTSGIYSVCPKI